MSELDSRRGHRPTRALAVHDNAKGAVAAVHAMWDKYWAAWVFRLCRALGGTKALPKVGLHDVGNKIMNRVPCACNVKAMN